MTKLFLKLALLAVVVVAAQGHQKRHAEPGFLIHSKNWVAEKAHAAIHGVKSAADKVHDTAHNAKEAVKGTTNAVGNKIGNAGKKVYHTIVRRDVQPIEEQVESPHRLAHARPKRHFPIPGGLEHSPNGHATQPNPSLWDKIHAKFDTTKNWVKNKAAVVGHDIKAFVARDKAIFAHEKQHIVDGLKKAAAAGMAGNLKGAVHGVVDLAKEEGHIAGAVLKKEAGELVHDVKAPTPHLIGKRSPPLGEKIDRKRYAFGIPPPRVTKREAPNSPAAEKPEKPEGEKPEKPEKPKGEKPKKHHGLGHNGPKPHTLAKRSPALGLSIGANGLTVGLPKLPLLTKREAPNSPAAEKPKKHHGLGHNGPKHHTLGHNGPKPHTLAKRSPASGLNNVGKPVWQTQPIMTKREAPNSPAAEKPQKPLGEKPLKPLGEKPLKPLGEKPLKPLGEKPQKPLGEKPLKPLGEKPLKPLGEKPLKPLGEKPQKPLGEKPQKPLGEKPEKPLGEKPQKPHGEKPEKPLGEKPQKPHGEKPEKPLGEKPQKPHGEKPQKPLGEKPEKPHGLGHNGFKPHGFGHNGFKPHGLGHYGFKHHGFGENGFKHHGFGENGLKPHGLGHAGEHVRPKRHLPLTADLEPSSKTGPAPKPNPSVLAKIHAKFDATKKLVKNKAAIVGHDIKAFVAHDKAAIAHEKHPIVEGLKNIVAAGKHGDLKGAIHGVVGLVKVEGKKVGAALKNQVGKLVHDVKAPTVATPHILAKRSPILLGIVKNGISVKLPKLPILTKREAPNSPAADEPEKPKGKKPHGKKSHGKKSHGKKSHGKKSHGKKQH